jgi:hypothetical protein
MAAFTAIRKELLSTSRKQCKDVGILAAAFLLIAGISTGNNLFQYVSLAMLGIILVFPAFFYPLAIVWFGLSRILGYLTSRLMLTIVFLLVVTPVAVARRAARKDSLKLKEFKKSKSGMFLIRNHIFNATDLKYPY